MNDEFRVRVLQCWVPQYRVALYEGVARRYSGRVDICSEPSKNDSYSIFQISGANCDYTHPIKKVGPFFVMKGVSLKGLKRGDVIVIDGNVRNIALMWLSILAKSKGIGVVWWGLHVMPNQRECNAWIRAWVMKRLSTSILFYNETGREWGKRMGMNLSHIFVAGNAIDQMPIKAAIEYWSEDKLSSFRKQNKIEGKPLIVACSRLSDKVRLHEMIEAMAKPQLPSDLLLAVIGDGLLAQELKDKAISLGVNNRIIWLGTMHDQMEMAPWFLSAKLYVYPGPVGLGASHAMAYGVPCVLNDTHNSTEVEVFENGKTGKMFKEFDIDSLATTIADLLKDEATLKKMGAYGQQRVFKNYSMEAMINNFCSAVDDAHKQVIKRK